MAIGMTYEQYWYGDPLMVRAYHKANRIRLERADEEAWLNGLYVLKALDVAVGNMFRESGNTPAEYPSDPLSVQVKREKKAKKAELDKERDAVWAKAWMSSFVQAGKNWKKG